MKKIVFWTILNFVALTALVGQIQYKSKYPDIPIVDVHVHISGTNTVSEYLTIIETVKQRYGSTIACIVGFNQSRNESVADLRATGKNRFIFTVRANNEHLGFFDNSAEIIEKVQKDKMAGLKFWFGAPYRRLKEGQAGITKIDDPRLAPYFAKLEKANVLMTSLHIADPNGPFNNRQVWMADPVYYWEQIRAFENVVAKYPNLTIVAAHGAWLVCQDAQLDYLRYMFSTYPNLYVDLSATFQYMPLNNYDNLRDFLIEYQDRILFGSDFGGRVADKAEAFASNFAILETDQMIDGNLTGVITGNNLMVKGLNLPKEVLEKIYYKNAVKLYPGLKEIMGL